MEEGPLILHSSAIESSMSGNSSYLILNLAICSFNPSPLKLSSGISLSHKILCFPEGTKIRFSGYSSPINYSERNLPCLKFEDSFVDFSFPMKIGLATLSHPHS